MKKSIMSFNKFDKYMRKWYDGKKPNYEKWDNLTIKDKQKMYRLCVKYSRTSVKQSYGDV